MKVQIQQSFRIDLDLVEAVEAYKKKEGISKNDIVNKSIRHFLEPQSEPVPEPDKEPFDVAKQYGLNMETGHNPSPVPEKTSGDAPDNVSSKPSTAEMEKRMGIE